MTRLRRGEGRRDRSGAWIPGEEVETGFRANVQPVALEDADEEGGARLSEKIKVYIPEEDSLLAAFDEVEADRVRWRGQTYVVERSMSWTASHCRAICLREV